MNDEVLDFMGNPITAGCTICYPVRRGSSMWLNRMVVTQVRPDEITGHSPQGRLTHVKSLQNVVVVVPPERK